jgi:ribosomal-protein-alanine N-acetyltransferase
MELFTKRLKLRSWREDDRPLFADLNADPHVRRWYPGVLSRAESDAVVDSFELHHLSHGFTMWAVEVIASDQGDAAFIGMLGLKEVAFEAPFDHTEPLIEIGWALSPEWWGMGLAVEGARAALEFGFVDCGLKEIVSFTVPPNLASQAVMQRIGMRYDGVFVHPIARGAWWGPHVLYRANHAQGEAS